MTIERFYMGVEDTNEWAFAQERPDADGPWVRYSDHAAEVERLETALQDARKFIARFDGNMPTASEDEGVFALLERIDEALATHPRDEGEEG